MLSPGPAKRVIIHINEDTSAATDFLYQEVIAFLRASGVAGATVIRPHAGFGSHRLWHEEDGDPAEREHLPVRIDFVDSPETVDRLLPKICEMVTDGLIELLNTTVVKNSRTGSRP